LQASKFITEDDLPSLVPSDDSEHLGNKLQKYLIKYGVWKSLFLAYGGPFTMAAILKITQVRVVKFLISGSQPAPGLFGVPTTTASPLAFGLHFSLPKRPLSGQ
jgi:hypothetical protein